MKEPTEHEPNGVPYEDYEICEADGKRWPCDTWQKWTASKDYRIAQLEEGLKREQQRTSGLEAQVREMAKTVRDDSNILRNGIFHAMTDLGTHERIGSLGLEWTVDDQDFTMMGGSHRVRVAGSSELSVIYVAVDGRVWTNGVVTEHRIGP